MDGPYKALGYEIFKTQYPSFQCQMILQKLHWLIWCSVENSLNSCDAYIFAEIVMHLKRKAFIWNIL